MSSARVRLLMATLLAMAASCQAVAPYGRSPTATSVDSRVADGPLDGTTSIDQRSREGVLPGDAQRAEGASPHDLLRGDADAGNCATSEQWSCLGFADYYCKLSCGNQIISLISCSSSGCTCDGVACDVTVSFPLYCAGCVSAFEQGCCNPN